MAIVKMEKILIVRKIVIVITILILKTIVAITVSDNTNSKSSNKSN